MGRPPDGTVVVAALRGFPMIPPQVNGATEDCAWWAMRLNQMFPMIPPQVNGATS